MNARHFLFLLTMMSLPVVASAATLRFSEQTLAAGLSFTHDLHVRHRCGPMCGGGAVGDFNGDGFPDLFLLGGGDAPDALFINNRDGTFSNRAAQWGVAVYHRGVAATVADYDDDGDDDIYVTSFGPLPEQAHPGAHRLLRNDGGYMTEVASETGLATTTTTNPDGYGAAFADYDRDGDLDLFVGGWHGSPSHGARLMRNDAGRYSDVTQSARITGAMHAFGAVWVDMDADGYPELIVAGDFGTARYFRNNRDGTFDELDPGSGKPADPVPFNWSIGKAHNAMGITVGDFDRDGRPDWFMTAIWPTHGFASPFWGNGLYLNEGAHRFAETAAGAGVADGGWGWGVSAVDLDNDGWTDLPMTNGWPHPDPVTGERFDRERAYVFRNRGDGTFKDVAVDNSLAHYGEGRALLHLDYDRDGDMDVVILENDGPARLFRNDLIVGGVPADAHWLQVRLDTRRNPSYVAHGLGASIMVQAGGVQQVQQVVSGGTYLGQSELVTHFGLGAAAGVERLEIHWANGRVKRFANLAGDRRITVRAPCPSASGPERKSRRLDVNCASQALPRPPPRPLQGRAARTEANHDKSHSVRNTK